MSKYFLIIDCDGTLVDTSQDIINSLNHALSSFNFPTYSRDEALEYVGHGVYPLIKERTAGKKLDEVITCFKVTYSSRLTESSKIYPGWEKVFSVSEKERTVILSNKPQEFLDAIVSKLKLDSVCTAWFGREAFKECKPSPVPVQMILSKFNVSKSDAIIVGDTSSDILSGKKAGIGTVAALYGYSKREDLLPLAPDYVIEKPEDLILTITERGK